MYFVKVSLNVEIVKENLLHRKQFLKILCEWTLFFPLFSGRVAKVRSLFPSTNLLCGYKKQTGHLHHDPTGHMDISKAISGGHS